MTAEVLGLLVEASDTSSRLGRRQSEWLGIQQATLLDALLDERRRHDMCLMHLSCSKQETLAFLELLDLRVIRQYKSSLLRATALAPSV